MNNTTTASPTLMIECESCDRDAEVTITYPDTTFTLCLRCVPAELRPGATALAGLEDLVDDIVQLLDEAHPAPPGETTAGGL